MQLTEKALTRVRASSPGQKLLLELLLRTSREMFLSVEYASGEAIVEATGDVNDKFGKHR